MSLVVSVLSTLLATASPASAIPAAVSATRTVSGFPRWYADQDGTRLEPCIDPADPFCVLVPNPPVFDPAAGPVVWPTNFPDEFFYNIIDSDVITTPGCLGTRPGKVLMRVALEGTFTSGNPTPGEQMVFGRVRMTASGGLCPNSAYTFAYPYGQITLTTDVDGALARNQATTDIGCAPAVTQACDFALALPSTVMTRFLRWNPAVAPAAPAGYLGDPNVLHPITGGPVRNNFSVSGPGIGVLSTNLFAVSGKLAGPLQSAPETLDGGNQPINIPSGPRTVTLTNVSPAVLATAAITVSPVGSAWSITGSTCASLAVDASCSVTLVFAPTVVGPANASLVIDHNSFRSPTIVPLVGNGTAAVAPNVSSSPASLDFGRALLATTAGPAGVVVHNAGPGTLVLSTTTVVDSAAGAVGDSAAFLPITANDCPVAGLVPGTSCTVSVSFRPTVQKPYAATLTIAGNVGANPITLTTPVSGRGGLAVSSTGADGLGPDGIGIGGFPTWYQDDRGVRLSQCLNAADPNCIVLADTTFNPALPLAFPTNYPGEAFHYIVDSEVMTTPGCGAASPPGKAAFRAATEMTFVNPTPTAGEQMEFNRVRVFVTSGLCPGQTYTFVHPYGTFTFVADDQGGLKRSPGTIDIGCTPGPGTPCNFQIASFSPVADGYLRWDASLPAPPAGYLGDPNVLHTIAGSPFVAPGATVPTNYVQIVDSANNVQATTNLFTVMGKIDATQTATRYQTVTPGALSFPATDTGLTSATQTVTIESVGTTPLTITGATVTGANPGDFVVTGTTCGVQAVGSRCNVTVAFRPTSGGPRKATLTIASNAANTFTGSVALAGTGVGAAIPQLAAPAPATLTFGNQLVGSPSPAQTVTLTNVGGAPLTITGATVGGPNAGDFAVTNGCATAVAAGATCALSVVFNPTATGARSASIAVTSDGGTATIALAGTGVAPVIAAAPAALTFAAATVGSTSVAQLVTVSNPGTAPLTVSGVTVGGLNAGDFAATNGCTVAIAPGATCTVSVTFTPAAAGARSATLSIASNGGTATVALTGTGVAAAPVLSAAPAALTFAAATVGTTSVAQNITVTNSGNAPLTVSGVTVGGLNAADFAVTNGCTLAVAAGATCTVAVRFTPAAAGVRSGSVAIASNGGTATVTLTGTGVTAAPVLAAAPAALTFANTATGATSAAQTVTVTNTGNAPLNVSGVTVGGLNAADFVATNNCTTAVAPAATCTISVVFRPTATGTRTGSLAVTSNGGNITAPLTGTGIVPPVVLTPSPTALAFGNVTVNQNGFLTLAIANRGTSASTTPVVTVTGANAGEFTLANGCTFPLAVNQLCNINVTFRPTATGLRAATLTVTASGVSTVVPLSGSGVGATIAATPTALAFADQLTRTTSPNQTVTLTNTGTAPLTLQGVSLQGAAFTDYTLPANTCGVGVVLAAGATCSVTVQFTPTAGGARPATLVVFSTAANVNPLTVALTGNGIVPPVRILASVPSVSFGNVTVNQQGFSFVTFTNGGSTNLATPTVSITGVNAADFTLTNGCTFSLIPNQQCNVNLTFRPTAVGVRNATLTVTSGTASVSVPLSGSGVGPIISVTPASLTFASQVSRTTSAPQTLTITNTGTAPLTLTGLSVQGTNFSEFTVNAATSTCAVSITLAPGASCSGTVVFRPTGLGVRTATLVVFSTAANANPLNVTVTGTGVTAVVNGSFETPALAAGAAVLNPLGTGWTFTSSSLVRSGNAALAGTPAIVDGAQVALLTSNTSRLSQTLTFGPGSVLTFRAAQQRTTINQVLNVFVDGVLQGAVVPTQGSYGTMTVFLNVTTTGAHTVELRGAQANIGTLVAGALVDVMAIA